MGKRTSNKEKNFNNKVRSIVNDCCRDELEEKHALKGTDSALLPSPSIPSGNVSGNANFVKLLPEIPQGIGQYNNRIGNEIRLKSMDITMLLQWKYGATFPEPSITDYKDSTIGVRVMILK